MSLSSQPPTSSQTFPGNLSSLSPNSLVGIRLKCSREGSSLAASPAARACWEGEREPAVVAVLLPCAAMTSPAGSAVMVVAWEEAPLPAGRAAVLSVLPQAIMVMMSWEVASLPLPVIRCDGRCCQV